MVDSLAAVPDTTGMAAAILKFLASWGISFAAVAGVIKVSAIVKWLLEKVFGLNITNWTIKGHELGSYGGWILVYVVGVLWSIFGHVAFTWPVVKEGLVLGLAAITVYGLANLGIFGTAGKRLATKPLI